MALGLKKQNPPGSQIGLWTSRRTVQISTFTILSRSFNLTEKIAVNALAVSVGCVSLCSSNMNASLLLFGVHYDHIMATL